MFLYSQIFWTDRGEPPKIESANLDGSNRKVLVSKDLLWPLGIAVDHANERIYWTDTKAHTVETSDFDGNDRKVVHIFTSKLRFYAFF